MRFSSNIAEVMQGVINDLQAITADKVTRTVAESMLGIVHLRIHQDGLDADGQPIGTYSPGYMKVRTGKFATNEVYKSGKKKGQLKPTGVFTKGEHKGEPRPRWNRTDDTKVVISLSKAMENDFSIQPTDKGTWGLGYTNNENLAKAYFAHNTYKKRIFDLTEQERSDAISVAQNYVNDQLRG